MRDGGSAFTAVPLEVLLRRMGTVDAEGKDDFAVVSAASGAYLDTLQSDLVVARAYQVEIDALGPPARERRRDSLKLSTPSPSPIWRRFARISRNDAASAARLKSGRRAA